MKTTYNGNDIFNINFGLYPFTEVEDIDLEETKENITKEFKEKYEEQLKLALDRFGLKYLNLEYYSPRYYNYETDSLDISIEIVDKTKLAKAIQDNKKLIQEKLDKNKSYDGYIALTTNSVEDELKNLNNDDYEVDTIVLSTLINDRISFDDFEIQDHFIYEIFNECEVCNEDDNFTECYVDEEKQKIVWLCNKCLYEETDRYSRIGDKKELQELAEEFKEKCNPNEKPNHTQEQFEEWLYDNYSTETDYLIGINLDYYPTINGEELNEEIAQKEMYEYEIRDREDEVENLINWLSETTRESDKELMKTDLKYLINLPDHYVFSSISTNDYIAKSDNKKRFNQIAKELLDLNKTIQEKDQKRISD